MDALNWKFHWGRNGSRLKQWSRESFRLFQTRVLEEYDKIATEFGLTVIDATLSIRRQQKIIREIVKEQLHDYVPTRTSKKKENVYVAKKNPYFGVVYPISIRATLKGK